MIKELSAMLPEDERIKLPKFYSDIVVAEENIENVKEIIKIFSENGLTFSKAVDLRTLTIEARVIIDRIENYREKNLFNVIKNDVSLLRFKSSILLSRISDCEKVGKGYLNEDGSLQNFITNDDEWEIVAEGLNLKEESYNKNMPATIDVCVEAEKVPLICEAMEQEKVSLDFEGLDRYSRLLKNLEAIRANINDIGDKEKDRAEFVIRNLVSSKKTLLSDEEILNIAIVTMKEWSIEEFNSIRLIVKSLVDTDIDDSLRIGGMGR